LDQVRREVKGRSERVVVAMSGGVDSSVAAMLLCERGYEVIGVTFRLWLDCELRSMADPRSCCSFRDMEAASQIARALGIRHKVIDLRDLFFREVVEPFVGEYLAGRTPNPCVECNRRVKFPVLARLAEEMGAAWIATGHYARLEWDEKGECSLLRARDKDKDQSYALYGVGQGILRRCLFPNGDLSKDEVRKAAEAGKLAVARKRESQEICFLSGGGYREFLSARFPEALQPGPLEDTSGRKLGEHCGLALFTVGQRKGLGLSAPWPLYVVALEPARRAVVVGRREEVPGRWLRADPARWVKGAPPGKSFQAELMARYNTKPVPCRVKAEGGAFEASCVERVWALTPGQHAVLFRGDEVLGGGVIVSAK